MTTPLLAPGAIWRPVQNHGGSLTGPLGLVVHVQQGDGSLAGWFNNPASQVSSHWWISAEGVLEQYVDAELQAWAQEAGNANYHSVETEGYTTSELTAAQLETLGELFTWGRETFGWPSEMCDHGGHGLTTHAHYPSGVPDPAWGGHPCPGPLRAAQLPSLFHLAAPTQETNPPGAGGTCEVVLDVIGVGDHGDDVRALQSVVNGLNGAHLVIDGIFGPATQAALEEYQRGRGLSVDGIAGVHTWSSLLGHPQ
jgi:hypothetical protein